MKKKYSSLLVLLSLLTIQQLGAQNQIYQKESGKVTPDKTISLSGVVYYPSSVFGNTLTERVSIQKTITSNQPLGKTNSVFEVNEIAKYFLASCSKELKMAHPEDQFALTSSQFDQINQSHIHMQQLYKGIRVYGAEIIVHVAQNQLKSIHGNLYNDISIPSVSPAIDESKSTTTCINDLKSKSIFRSLAPDEQKLLQYTGPSSELIIYNNDLIGIHNKLAWAVHIQPNLLESWDYYVDAQTNDILYANNKTCAADGPRVTTVSDINGTSRSINTYQVGNSFYMIDGSKSVFNPNTSLPNRPQGSIWTLDAQNTATLNLAQLTNTDNLSWSAKSVSAQYHAGLVFDYFKNTHGLIPINQGGNMVSVINVTNVDGTPLDNLFWNGQCLLYGNGNTNFRALVGSLDLAAHEMTHGIIQNSVNLEYQGQSGAINESMADIFGCMLDKSDWTIGEDVVKSAVFPSGALRNLQDPHNGTTQGNTGWQPSHMSEYYTGSSDNGGVHLNSGILNRAYYLLSMSISTAKAEKIYFRALTTYLTRYSQFNDLRFGAVQSAMDLYGNAASEVNAVKTAFDAVGIFDNGNAQNYAVELAPNTGIENLLVYNPIFFNPSRLYIAKTDGSTPSPLTATSCKMRPSVPDDGSFCVFVDTLGQVKRVDLIGPSNETRLFPSQSNFANVAISKDGSKLAAVTTASDTSIFIYSFQSASWFQFKLYNPSYVNGITQANILKAGALEWDYKGENVLFDAKYKLGDTSYYWDISSIQVWNNNTNNVGSGKVEKLVNQLPTGVSVSNPTFSKNSPYIIAYDYFNRNDSSYAVYSKNLITGKANLITVNNMLGTPSFNRLDDHIIFDTYDKNLQDTSLWSIGINSTKIEANGGPSLLMAQHKWGNWYTQGQRKLISDAKNIFSYQLSSLSPKAPGIVIGDSILVKVSETASLSNVVADYTLSPFCKATIAGVAQISGNTKNNFSAPLVYTVTAPDNSSKQYTVITQRPSNSKEITAFSFNELTPVVNGVILNDTITLQVPVGTDITELRASYTASAFSKVTVDNVIQQSNVTVNDYSTPLIYKVTAYDSTTRNYTVIVKSNTGLNELAEYSKIAIYPNPSNQWIHADISQDAAFEIYDFTGKTLLKGALTHQTIDVNQLTSGLYFITFTTSSGKFAGKFIKQ